MHNSALVQSACQFGYPQGQCISCGGLGCDFDKAFNLTCCLQAKILRYVYALHAPTKICTIGEGAILTSNRYERSIGNNLQSRPGPFIEYITL